MKTFFSFSVFSDIQLFLMIIKSLSFIKGSDDKEIATEVIIGQGVSVIIIQQ